MLGSVQHTSLRTRKPPTMFKRTLIRVAIAMLVLLLVAVMLYVASRIPKNNEQRNYDSIGENRSESAHDPSQPLQNAFSGQGIHANPAPPAATQPDSPESLDTQIAAVEQSLRGLTPEKNRTAYRDLQTTLGGLWEKKLQLFPERFYTYNRYSIMAYQCALAASDKATEPAQWAQAHLHLADQWATMAAQPGSRDQQKLLHDAIADDKAALSVLNPKSHPDLFTQATQKLADHTKTYQAAGFDKQTPIEAIKPAE
jgi:hypothetical protein